MLSRFSVVCEQGGVLRVSLKFMDEYRLWTFPGVRDGKESMSPFGLTFLDTFLSLE